MIRSLCLFVSLSLCLALSPGAALADGGRARYTPGAPGIGDPYFPLDGNGGYDVQHYDLDLGYDPATDVLRGAATIKARATQNLSSFNLDFVGLRISSITVDDRKARWTRDGDELVVTPRHGLRKGCQFSVRVKYAGTPETLPDESGFFHTDDGALVIGEPDVAATWFPVNDHPIDQASYTFRITVPKGLEAISNGVLRSTRTRHNLTTWVWDAKEPMASYLAMMAVGEFNVRGYRDDGIRFFDAIDPALFAAVAAPRTGERYAYSGQGDVAYKRLARTIEVPDAGAQLSFFIDRETEPSWDFVFVEARPADSDDWTTLPENNGHTSQDTGSVCPFSLELHPFLAHYQSDNGDDTCSPTGDTGEWWAASGASDGFEEWSFDLTEIGPGPVEVAISYVTDTSVQLPGVFVDDITVSTGPGTTSFEDDGDTFDGWTVPGAPEGSPGNASDWISATVDDNPPSIGEVAENSLARQGEIIEFLEESFGPYPFSAAGGIVDHEPRLTFALETQTRPIYPQSDFGNSLSGDAVVVHELAHQWYGDSLAVQGWQHIWLNEGFASYAEWLWQEREDLGNPQEIFDSIYADIPADDAFWELTIGDPGPDNLFAGEVYTRGAMTLQALRMTVGDEAFFTILRRWATRNAGENVTTREFVALSERVSGQELSALFDAWLFTPTKPDAPGLSAGVAERLAAPGAGQRSWLLKGQLP